VTNEEGAIIREDMDRFSVMTDNYDRLPPADPEGPQGGQRPQDDDDNASGDSGNDDDDRPRRIQADHITSIHD